jgi:hypothetical protein
LEAAFQDIYTLGDIMNRSGEVSERIENADNWPSYNANAPNGNAPD